MSTSPKYLLGGLALVAVGIVAVAALGQTKGASGSKATPGPTSPLPGTGYENAKGFQVLQNCKGINLYNEAAALKWAAGLGAKAPAFTSNDDWFGAAGKALGIPASCRFPPASTVSAYAIFRAYVRAARDSGRISPERALGVMAFLRVGALTAGAEASRLPEGL